MDDWLGTTEAGALLGVTRQSVERWIRDGRLPARVVWHGRHKLYRIRRRDLADFARRWIRDEWT